VEFNGALVILGCKLITMQDGRQLLHFPNTENLSDCPRSGCGVHNPYWKKKCHSCQDTLPALHERAEVEPEGWRVMKQTEFHHPLNGHTRGRIIEAINLAVDEADARGHDYESCTRFCDGDPEETFDPDDMDVGQDGDDWLTGSPSDFRADDSTDNGYNETGRIADETSLLLPDQVWLKKVVSSEDKTIALVNLRLDDCFLLRCCKLTGNLATPDEWKFEPCKRSAPRVCFNCDHANEPWRAMCDECYDSLSDSNVSNASQHASFRETMRWLGDETLPRLQQIVVGAYQMAFERDHCEELATVRIEDGTGEPLYSDNWVHFPDAFSTQIKCKPERRRRRGGRSF